MVVVFTLIGTCLVWGLLNWIGDRRFERKWEKMSYGERRRLQEAAYRRQLM